MNHLYQRRPHGEVTGLTGPQAQVDVAQAVGEGHAVQTVQLVEQRFTHHQAHHRHRRVVLLQRQPVQVTFGVVFFTNKG
ncbi:hypothetical protein D3C76_1480060 [compost metagenome]